MLRGEQKRLAQRDLLEVLRQKAWLARERKGLREALAQALLFKDPFERKLAVHPLQQRLAPVLRDLAMVNARHDSLVRALSDRTP